VISSDVAEDASVQILALGMDLPELHSHGGDAKQLVQHTLAVSVWEALQ
jgi:hypothetical protein